jgi:small subunit ribosomal protein S8
MVVSDPVADMLTRIRNAVKAKFNSVDIPGSKLKTELAKLLKDEGFVRNYKVIKDNRQDIIRLYLKYGKDNTSAILGLRRISKPSRRVYTKSAAIKPVFSGMGVAVISTSKGLMSDRQARQENVGGEVLCNLW